MKNFIFISILTIFAIASSVTFSSCNKDTPRTTDVTPNSNSEFYEGDQYDQGLVVEEPEKIDIPDEDVYQSEASGIEFLQCDPLSSDFNKASYTKDPFCTNDFKYPNHYRVGTENDFSAPLYIKLTTSDSIINVTSTNTDMGFNTTTLNKVSDRLFALNMFTKTELFKAKNVTIKVTLATGKIVSGKINIIGINNDGSTYSTTIWGVKKEREIIGKIGSGDRTILQAISTSYIPQKGDILYFGEISASTDNNAVRQAVITTIPTYVAAKTNKPAAYKFKIVEWNAKCTGKRSIKSISMTDPTQIKSADGVTFATKYFRD